jgi:hypothetical protein
METKGRPVGGSGVLPYLNPPFVAAMFAPLALLPIGLFSGALFLIEIGAIVGGGVSLSRLLALERPGQRGLFWLVYLTCLSTTWVVLQQQLSMFLFFGWFGFAWFLMRGQHKLSGISLALLLVKPHAVLLPAALLLWKRDWEAFRPFAVIATILVLFSVAISGPSVLVEYPLFLLESGQREGVNTSTMFGWNGFIAGITDDGTPPLLLLAPFILSSLGTLIWAIRRETPWESQRGLPFLGLCLIVSLLLNPHLHLQDLVLLNLALAFGAAHHLSTTSRLGYWVPLAIVVWVAQLYGLKLQDVHGISVLTPVLALTLLTFVLALKQPATREVNNTSQFGREASQAA